MSRDDDWNRISALAGVDADGGIMPPGPEFVGINREPKPWWNTNRVVHSDAECTTADITKKLP